MTTYHQLVPANFVPAAAVIRKGRALFGMIGRKACVDCFYLFLYTDINIIYIDRKFI
uniref:Uncharacterized protein n=1 Tax=Auxenochlorella protothecoides TaxID=3075 RepID=A0A1Z1GBN5_AUXPR|nr:hypothetical protein BW920_0084 [Auxenochlorella protothecoides]